jgi:8-oxo-dGTP pyrophosphatase MutT (NUDIX family)
MVISNKYKKNAADKHVVMKTKWFDSNGNCLVHSKWTEAEWGLPKGRRNNNESNLNVAFREFWEETGIIKNYIRIIHPNPVNETYVANNNHTYCNNYFIATWNSSDVFNINKIIKTHKHLYSFKAEISAIYLYTKEEFISKLREYEMSKKILIE